MQCRTERAASASSSLCAAIGRCAARALFFELACRPKPGLVSLRDRGSHPDMDAALFLRSILVLRPFFASLALAGLREEPFGVLREIGGGAEAAMLRATGGVNTHRGAVFSLGLLAAAAGRVGAGEGELSPGALVGALLGAWGNGIAAHETPPESHGSRACRRYGVPGARGEAARGFPAIFVVGLPALEDALGCGCDFNRAMVQAFFKVLTVLDDTNLYHRGGCRGVEFARECARGFLDAGGVIASAWERRAEEVHRRFTSKALSPGGAGDVLAGAVFVHLISGRREWASR